MGRQLHLQETAQPAELIQLCVLRRGAGGWQCTFLCCHQPPETLTILLYPEGACEVRHFDGVLSNRCFCSQREGQIHNASHRCNIQPLCNSVPFGVLHRYSREQSFSSAKRLFRRVFKISGPCLTTYSLVLRAQVYGIATVLRLSPSSKRKGLFSLSH